jgi:DNA-binding Xre family transcriptional regulator
MAKSFDELVKRTTSLRTRQRAAKRTQELLAELVMSELREARGKSQTELAAMLGMKQPSLSKLEKQSDMQISTLRKIVLALGGKLEVTACFPQGTVKLVPFSDGRRKRVAADR